MTLFTVINTWVTGWSWTNAQTAASYGDEIGSHTVTHTSLGGLSNAQQLSELTNSQNAINAHVTNQLCVTLAYPNCSVGNESLVAQYYIAARICSQQVIPSTPPDFMQISSFICGVSGSVQTLQNFKDTANSAAVANGWSVYLIHGIDNDGGYSPLPSATLQDSVNFFSTNQNKYWVETFGNVVRYIKERNASSVAETANTGTNITLQVINSLDKTIYNYPITLRRPMLTNWLSASVTQNGKDVGAQVVIVGTTNFLMFDVVPNAGDVTISGTVIVVVAAPQTLGTLQDQAVSLPGLKLLAGSSDSAGFALAVTGVSSNSAQGGTVTWDGSLATYTPPPGFAGSDTFYYTLSDGHGGAAQGTVLVTVVASGTETLNKISVQLTPTNCQLQFAGIPEREYIIQSAPAVSGPWTDLSGPIAADGTGLIQFIDTNVPGPMQFYRTSPLGGNP